MSGSSGGIVARRGPREVQEALERKGLPVEVRCVDGARTVEETAAALAVPSGQVIKAIAVRGKSSDGVIVILAAGTGRIDLDAVAARLGRPVEPIPAEQVESMTGYPVGSLPPVGFDASVRVILHESFPRGGPVYAGTGLPGYVGVHRAVQLRSVFGQT